MEAKLYFRMLQRSWWILVVTGLAAAVAALAFDYVTPPVYEAKSRLIVSPSPSLISGGTNNLVNGLSTLDKRSIITTYAEILNSPRIRSEAIKILELQEASLNGYSYSAVALPDANIIELSVRGSNSATAARLANGIGQHTIEYVQSLYQVYDLSLLDPATTPVEPISPQPLRDGAVALVLGLAIGVLLVLVRELLRLPIQSFIRQRNLDDASLALSRNAFEEALANAALDRTGVFSLCIVHLSGLSDYINILPQTTLNMILRNVTQTLKNQLRGNDLVGRWSELDYTVLLSKTPSEAAVNTMERVRLALSVPIVIDVSADPLRLDPQVGIAEYCVGDTPQSMIKNIQSALERARSSNGLHLLTVEERSGA
jgi:capsular polysaccharide biosynthesis protein